MLLVLAEAMMATTEVVVCSAEVALTGAVVLAIETLLLEYEAPLGGPPLQTPCHAAVYPIAG